MKLCIHMRDDDDGHNDEHAVDADDPAADGDGDDDGDNDVCWW